MVRWSCVMYFSRFWCIFGVRCNCVMCFIKFWWIFDVFVNKLRDIRLVVGYSYKKLYVGRFVFDFFVLVSFNFLLVFVDLDFFLCTFVFFVEFVLEFFFFVSFLIFDRLFWFFSVIFAFVRILLDISIFRFSFEA